MKANMTYQKKRRLIIIAIIAALVIVATVGTVAYVTGNRRAAAVSPEVVDDFGNANNGTGNDNGVNGPTEIPQLGDLTGEPNNNGAQTNDNGNGNNGNGQFTQTIVIPEGGDTVLVAETDARSWKPVGDNKNISNGVLDVDITSGMPNLNSNKYAIMHGSDSDNAIQQGEKITYVIELTNNGDEEATNIYVYDTVPTGTELIDGTVALYKVDSEGNEQKIQDGNVSGNLLSWKIDTIAAGETLRAKFDVTATLIDEEGNTVTKIINTAIADGEEIEPTVTTPVVTSEKTASLVEDGVATLLGEDDTVKVGQTIRYTITVKNTGDAEGSITVSDTVPEGTEYIPGTLVDENGDAVDEAFFTEGVVVNVPANGEGKVSFDVKINSATDKAIKNVAKVGDDEITDDPDGKKVAKINTVKTSEGIITEGTVLHVSDKINYTLTITNTGDGKGTVKISDEIPTNTKLDTSTPIKLSGDDKEYSVEELNAGIDVELEPGETKTITFTVIITAFEGDETTIINNMAKQDGEDGSINTTEDEVKKEFIDVSITKNWNDANATELRGNVEFELYANGVATGNKVTATADNNWQVLFEHVEKHDADGEIVYTVVENTTLENYEANNTPVSNGGEITNKLDTTSDDLNNITVTITKVWNDNNDAEGKRTPATFTLWQKIGDSEATEAKDDSGNTIAKVTTDTNITFENLPKYGELSDGTIAEITYTVREIALSDYNTTYADQEGNDVTAVGEITNGGTITNTLKWEDIISDDDHKITVIKNWNDTEENAGGSGTGSTLVDLWKGSQWFGNGLGNTLSEEAKAVIKDYLESQPDQSDIDLIITYRGPLLTQVNVTYSCKVNITIFGRTFQTTVVRTRILPRFMYVDDADSSLIVDTMRPESLTVTISPETEPVNVESEAKITDTITLTADENWQEDVNGLRIYDDDGNKITYKVEEVVPDGYELESIVKTVDGDNTTYTITNKEAEPEVSPIDIVVNKIWDDNNNAEGFRPDSVEITLYANGEATNNKITLSGDSWTGKFESLPAVDADKNPISYTVVEENAADHYTATVDLEVPADGEVATEITYIVTNTLNWSDVSNKKIEVEKVWSGVPEGLSDDYKPEVTFTLTTDDIENFEDITIPLNGTAAPAFDNLRKYNDAGDVITYTVTENVSSEQYFSKDTNVKEVTFGDEDSQTVTFTNTFKPETVNETTFTFTKVWDDNNNIDNLRPSTTDSIFTLKGDGEAVNATPSVVDNEDGTWTITYRGLQTFNSQKAIVYEVEEATIEHYTTDNNKVSDNGTITNTLKWEDVISDDDHKITVIKNWNDTEENSQGSGTGSTLVDLWKGSHWFGNGLGNTLSEEAKAVIKAYLESKVGSEIEFQVTYRGPLPTLVNVLYSYKRNITLFGRTITITQFEEVLLPRFMYVDDADSSLVVDTMRPESITVTILPEADSVNVDSEAKITDTITLTADENWQEDVNGLRIYDDDGNKISYKVEEADIEGYELESIVKTVDGNNTTFTITNKEVEQEASTIDIVVNKIWDDNDNAEGLRPTSIELTLYANGAETDNKVTLSGDNWTGKFEDLPTVDDNKNPISYTVIEEENDNYTASIEIGDSQDATVSEITYNITNTLNWENISSKKIEVEKVWSGVPEGLSEDYKPEVTFTLTTDDIANFEDITVPLNGPTAPVFENLRKYNDAGEEVTYKITENVSSEQYFSKDTSVKEVTFGDEDSQTVTFTNTFKPETVNETTFTFTKVWDDNNNAEGFRSLTTDSIFTLKGDGEAVNATPSVVDNEDGTWTITYRGLQTFNSQSAIVYEVEEANIDHYTTENNKASNNGTITNTLKWEETKISIPIEKVWDDNNNAYGKRTNITVVLKANNAQLDSNPSVELSAQNKKDNDPNTWVYTFENVRKYNDNGTEIDYTLDEENIPDGYVISSVEKSNGKIIITNSLPRIKVTKSVYNLNNGEPISSNETVKVSSGDIVGYKITIQNTGSVDFTNVEVEDLMSSGENVYKTYADAQNGTNSISSIIVSDVSLAVGEYVKSDDESNYIIVYYVVTDEDVQDVENTITNTATAKGYYNNTYVLSDEVFAVVKVEEFSKITISKDVVSNKTTELEPGDTVTYQITVTNVGNTLQENVIVEDEMNNNPAGDSRSVTISSVQVNGENRSYTLEDGKINIGSLQWNETATITVTYTLQESDMAETTQRITNKATLIGKTDETGGTIEDYSDAVETCVWKADISAEKSYTITRNSGNNSKLEPGDVVNYVITATNSGRKAGSVTVKDSIPSHTQLTGSITVKDANGTRTVSSSALRSGITVNVNADGGKATVEFSVKILADALGNTITNQATYINENGEEATTNNTQTEQVSKNLDVEAIGERVNYILAVDCSKSMFYNKIEGGFIGFFTSDWRYKVAEAVINQFKDSALDDNNNNTGKIQIVEYVGPNDDAELAQTITSSSSNYNMRYRTWFRFPGTDLYKGLEKVQSIINSNKAEDPNARNVVIVLSDGKQENHALASDILPYLYAHSDDEVVAKANQIRGLGAEVYCIGFSKDADEGLLRRVAGTSSNCWLGKNGADTLNAFNKIISKVEDIKYTVSVTSATKTFDLKNYQLRATTSVVITYDGNESGDVYNFSSTGTNGPLTYSRSGSNYSLTFDVSDYADKSNLKITYYLR